MTRDQAKQLLPIMAAYADGKTIQAKFSNRPDRWDDQAVFSDAIDPHLEWRIKPEPKLRPWKADEVPVGKVVRFKDTGERHAIHGVIPNLDVALINNGRFTPLYLLGVATMEDGSPCGVTEDAQ